MRKLRVFFSLMVVLSAVAPMETARAATGAPDGYGYTWIDSNEPGGPFYGYLFASTPYFLGDDDYLEMPIGFDFDFYGNTYSTITVTSNGHAHFDGATYLSYTNYPLPYGVYRQIAPFWDDLNPSASAGALYISTEGAAPNRVMIIEWWDILLWGGIDDIEVEILLYETTNVIEFHYADVYTADALHDYGASATVGIADGAQGYGLQYSYDTASLNNFYAIRFEPPGACSDADGDGFQDTACGGTDCNDANASIHPGAPEYCNGIDDDCDGIPDNNPVNPNTYYQDIDGDGFGNPLSWVQACSPPGGYVANSGDCNDSNGNVHPGALEICDGIADNNCDGVDDPNESDIDGDMWNACAGDCDESNPQVNPGAWEVCDGHPDNNCDGILDPDEMDDDFDLWTECEGDCNDANNQVHPGMNEICDGILDNNCDGANDPDEQDNDGDAWTECDGDCNDANPQVHPGMTEICDGILDNDCNGFDDPAETDDDGDGWNECNGDCDDGSTLVYPGAAETQCDGLDNDCNPGTPDAPDADGDGYTVCDDCDDGNANIHPGATEIPCNGVDDDCNPATADGPDQDGDGYSTCAGDCDDANAAVNPGATEICNNIDDDCDGTVDVGAVDAGTWYLDNDGDGFGTDASMIQACQQPPNHVALGGDCNDGNPTVNPAAIEVCNGIDDDCDPSTDDYADMDGDGFSLCDGDCDDSDAAVNPGAEEICNNGVDDDCDPATDELVDGDGDGWSICYGDCDDTNPMTFPPAPEICDGADNNCDGVLPVDEQDLDADGVMECDGDCDDNDPLTHPGAPEQCDGLDNDCDGIIDEDVGIDQDGDGYTPCQGDCDDNDPLVYAGAVELCDGLDNDCDGIVPADEIDNDLDGFAPCDGDCDDNDPDLHLYDIDGDGWTSCDGDCDDANAAIHPGASEQCNGLDDNCDGAPGADEVDADSDGFLACEECDDTNPALNEGDWDGDGWTTCDGDCDDDNSSVFPSASEVCDDGIDNDCDGLIDLLDDDCFTGDDDTASDDDDDTGDDDDTASDDDTDDPSDDDDGGFGTSDCDCQSDLARGLGGPLGLLLGLFALVVMRRAY